MLGKKNTEFFAFKFKKEQPLRKTLIYAKKDLIKIPN